MSADKRSVSTDALETLGTIIDEREKRDAIHLAVEPVEAGEYLYPGEHVGIASDGKAYNKGPKLIGIVDPFLGSRVNPGQRFWFVIYPRQITSLRHVWTHPVLDGQQETPKDPKAASEQWLRDFIARSDCPDYETVVAKAVQNKDDKYLHVCGYDAHGEIPPEFWDHIEIVTGKKIEGRHRANWFSCSC